MSAALQTEPLIETEHQDTQRTMSILAVEDDPLAMQFLQAQIEGLGHHILSASNGQEALEVLAAHHETIDVVLMDRHMPVMDGLLAIEHMKHNEDFRHIPVIMVTGANSAEEMGEGMAAGVFYYLTKPVQEEMLTSVLSAAVREATQHRVLAKELAKHRTSFQLIDSCRFMFRTLSEAEGLAAFIANCFPEPLRVLPGLGELLINAVEHGNLGISYDQKSKLIANDGWREEIERRQEMLDYAGKVATATVARKEDGVYVVIEDQGDGFQWQSYMQIDLSRSGDNHGRGIALANATSFDKMNYNDKGNKVVAFVGFEAPLDW